MTDIDPNFIDGLYRGLVRRDVFSRARPAERPVLVLVGAQPGAGKSRAMFAATAEFAPTAVVVSGDNFRRFHPDFERLRIERPQDMPNVTSGVSGPLVQRVLDDAIRNRFSIALEGTFRDAAVVGATAQRFKSAGFAVCVVALAVPHQQSRLSAEGRFLVAAPRDARWTPPTAHDRSYEAMPQVLTVLESNRSIDTIAIYTRSGKVYSNTRDAVTREWTAVAEAVTVLHRERSRPLSSAQAHEWLEGYAATQALAQNRQGYLTDERVAATYRALAADAATVRTWATKAADATAPHEKGDHRARSTRELTDHLRAAGLDEEAIDARLLALRAYPVAPSAASEHRRISELVADDWDDGIDTRTTSVDLER